MVATVKFLIFAHGNIVRGEEGTSYDRDPLRKIRVQTDASYEDLIKAICTRVNIDQASHQITVRHRHPKFVKGRVFYSLLPILDDTDVEDLVEMAEKMGEEFIQELYVEIHDRSIALSEHGRHQPDATMPSTPQVPLSKHDRTFGDEGYMSKRARYDILLSKDISNGQQEMNRVLEDADIEMDENLIIADLRNENPSQNVVIYELPHPVASPISPSWMSMNITNGMEEGNQTSRASSSTTPPRGQDYEVFLSFRGLDTRHGFTDHLYNGLLNAGVRVFRDNEELHVGKEIGPELLKAIKDSKVSIPIISKSYASSIWCLKELVQILECMKTLGLVVLPIFHQVEPSEVRNQTGDFGNGLFLCKRKHDIEDRLIQEWKNALMEVASLKGWESYKTANGHEGELVQIVVHKVVEVLRKVALPVSDHLVGVEDHVEKIIAQLTNAKRSDGVQVVLIHGMGGIGKTTLAKVLYNQLSNHFKHCSYITNIREISSTRNGKEHLQKQLISNILGGMWPHDITNVDEGINIICERFRRKTVLLLLDDVDHRDQLNVLVRKSEWFGSGSIIIITSRKKDVLEKRDGIFSYELYGLDPYQSFLLFCKHAFRRSDSIPNEYNTIAREIVSTTGGLPLAIEVIGSLLYGKAKYFWEGNLKMLKEIPHHEVQSKLKISFDTLQPEDKEIFLDITCLPLHKKRELAFHMWDSCGFFPQVQIEKLISLSLIKIGEKEEFIIHDQLRDLGREIVRQESINNLGRRSRLWKEEEAREVIELKQGTREIQALSLVRCKTVHHEQLEEMTELRYLRMEKVDLRGDLEKLFQNLRWLSWDFGELDFMESNFIPKKLVVLELSYVNIISQWMGWTQMKRLKVLNLMHCYYLTTTPDFSVLKELEVLVLEWCTDLRSIHPSIGKLSKTLKILNVKGCKKLEVLPIEMGKMEELRELVLDSTPIKEIPISEGYMTKLRTLSAEYCKNLKYIPDSIGSLVKLQRLELYKCKLLTKIPKSIGKLNQLTKLDLDYTGVTQLPDSLGNLCNLVSLHLSNTPIRYLPTSIPMLSKLQKLNLWLCYKLRSLPNLPCSLTSLVFYGNLMETLPDFSSLTNLEHLLIKDDFGRWNRALNFGNLNRLRILRFRHSIVSASKMGPVLEFYEDYSIKGFTEVSGNINLLLELPSSLVELRLQNCYTLRTLPNFSSLRNLSHLYIRNCPELMKIDGLDGVESLKQVEIAKCRKLVKINGMGISVANLILEDLGALESLPHLSTAKKLKDLRIFRCRNLVEIKELDNVEGIQNLLIARCSSLERIGDFSHLKMLTTLKLCYCEKLSKIRGLETLTSLKVLDISGCTALLGLPDLLNVHIKSDTLEEDEESESDSDLLEREDGSESDSELLCDEGSESDSELLYDDGSESDSNPLKE